MKHLYRRYSVNGNRPETVVKVGETNAFTYWNDDGRVTKDVFVAGEGRRRVRVGEGRVIATRGGPMWGDQPTIELSIEVEFDDPLLR